jgi:hypothetical protein
MSQVTFLSPARLDAKHAVARRTINAATDMHRKIPATRGM